MTMVRMEVFPSEKVRRSGSSCSARWMILRSWGLSGLTRTFFAGFLGFEGELLGHFFETVAAAFEIVLDVDDEAFDGVGVRRLLASFG